jgi:hypothetical protein
MRILPALLLAASLAARPAPLTAASQTDPVSLTGLTAISVVVEDVPSAASRAGLSTSALQADAERALRRAGITITPDSDAYLYIHILVSESSSGAQPLPYFVEVSLMQEITLPRNVKSRTPLQAPTWTVNRLGAVGPDQLRATLGGRVSQFVDEFVKAFRAVNPKQ